MIRLYSLLAGAFPFLAVPLSEAMAEDQHTFDGLRQGVDDASQLLALQESRIAALEIAIAPSNPPQDQAGDVWPAPPWGVWVQLEAGAAAQAGEAQDAHGRDLRIPDPMRPGYVRALVPRP